MPDVGDYWHADDGRVVRVLEDDGSFVTFLRLNTFFDHQRRRVLERIDSRTCAAFINEYTPGSVPEVTYRHVETGSLWYDRNDIDRLVEVYSVEYSLDTSLIRYRLLRGSTTRVWSLRFFLDTFIRIDNYNPRSEVPARRPHAVRHWVIGPDVAAPFPTEVEAQAFLFETSMMMQLPTTAFHIARRDSRRLPRSLQQERHMRLLRQRVVNAEADAAEAASEPPPETTMLWPDDSPTIWEILGTPDE